MIGPVSTFVRWNLLALAHWLGVMNLLALGLLAEHGQLDKMASPSFWFFCACGLLRRLTED
jgi:hypothetical protein